jgi:hypothetical protein
MTTHHHHDNVVAVARGDIAGPMMTAHHHHDPVGANLVFALVFALPDHHCTASRSQP